MPVRALRLNLDLNGFGFGGHFSESINARKGIKTELWVGETTFTP